MAATARRISACFSQRGRDEGRAAADELIGWTAQTDIRGGRRGVPLSQVENHARDADSADGEYQPAAIAEVRPDGNAI
jgi:hypothetical protein